MPSSDLVNVESKNVSTVGLGKKVLRGSILQFGGRFFFRGLKFIRTIVVARMLFPEDVGLFALASLCLGFVDTFIQSGFQGALVQRKEITREHLDGAWTIHVYKGILLGAIYFCMAPLLATFFDEPRLVLVAQVLSIIKVLDGFSNIGVILFQRELQFGKKMLYEFAYNITEIIVLIVVIQIIPNIWALVIGNISYYVAVLVFSYLFHSYRPRLTFNLDGARELFHFGKWLWLGGILTFFVSNGDSLAVSKLISIEALAYYQLAFSLALLPAYEVMRSLGSVLFPLFSRIKDSREKLVSEFLRVGNALLLVVLPMSVVLYSLREPIVSLLYGDRWLPMVPLLGILIFYGIFKAFEYLLTPVLLGAGYSKTTMLVTTIQGIALALLIVPCIHWYGIVGVPLALLASIMFSTIYLISMFLRHFPIRLSAVGTLVTMPVLSSLGLLGALSLFMNKFNVDTVLECSFALSYALVIYGGIVFILDRFFDRRVQATFVWIRNNIRQ